MASEAAVLQAPARAPPVAVWLKVYAGVMATANLAMAAILVLHESRVITVIDAARSGWPWTVAYVAFLLLHGVFYSLPLGLRPRPWLWTYDLVVICFGAASLFLLPVCLPLLIYWVKPKTKAFFRTA